MQIIIDIPEDVYTRLFDNGIQDNEIAVDDVCEMARALRLGTPLDEKTHKKPKRTRKPKDDDWSGAQGNDMSRIITDQKRGKWGIYG